MFSPSALLARLLPCCAANSTDPGAIHALLDKNNIGILSAACCDATAAQKDAALKANLLTAMEKAGDKRAVLIETITSAQQHLRALEAESDPDKKRLVQNVVALFQANGLSIFPLLIINGRVACYGGVPSVELIGERLNKSPIAALGA